MNFVPLICEADDGLGPGCCTLPCSVSGSETLIYGSPKHRHSLWFGVEKVLKKSNVVQWLRIGVQFPILRPVP
jgi:hypothetical protein